MALETQARNGQKEGLEEVFQKLRDKVEAFKIQLEDLVLQPVGDWIEFLIALLDPDKRSVYICR